MKGILPKKIEEANVKVRVDKGRIIVAGREYHTSHAYLKGCDRAVIQIAKDAMTLSAWFEGLPEIRSENAAIVVHAGNYNEEKIINDTIKKINREGNRLKAVLVPLKLRVWGDNSGVQVFIDEEDELRTAEISMDIEAKSIINFITWPFPAVWIYVNRAYLDLENKGDKIRVIIKNL